MNLFSPMMSTIKITSSATSSFKPSGHSTSESVPQGTSTTDEVTTVTRAPSRDSHTTQPTTTNHRMVDSTNHHDTTLGTSGGTSLSITSTTNSSFSQSAPGPAVTWSSTTRFTSHPSLLSVTGTSPTFTGSTMKAETSGRGNSGVLVSYSGPVSSIQPRGMPERER